MNSRCAKEIALLSNLDYPCKHERKCVRISNQYVTNIYSIVTYISLYFVFLYMSICVYVTQIYYHL